MRYLALTGLVLSALLTGCGGDEEDTSPPPPAIVSFQVIEKKESIRVVVTFEGDSAAYGRYTVNRTITNEPELLSLKEQLEFLLKRVEEAQTKYQELNNAPVLQEVSPHSELESES